MPLFKGKSKKAFKKNVEAEMDAGKPQPQALAIAYSMKRQAGKKMAAGGEVEPSPKSIVEAIRMKKKSSMDSVDLQDNGDEDDGFEEAKMAPKKAYYDLDQVESQPEDSNLEGRDLSDEDEHNASMIASIMKKMRSKRE